MVVEVCGSCNDNKNMKRIRLDTAKKYGKQGQMRTACLLECICRRCKTSRCGPVHFFKAPHALKDEPSSPKSESD